MWFLCPFWCFVQHNMYSSIWEILWQWAEYPKLLLVMSKRTLRKIPLDSCQTAVRKLTWKVAHSLLTANLKSKNLERRDGAEERLHLQKHAALGLIVGFHSMKWNVTIFHHITPIMLPFFPQSCTAEAVAEAAIWHMHLIYLHMKIENETFVFFHSTPNCYTKPWTT